MTETRPPQPHGNDDGIPQMLAVGCGVGAMEGLAARDSSLAHVGGVGGCHRNFSRDFLRGSVSRGVRNRVQPQPQPHDAAGFVPGMDNTLACTTPRGVCTNNNNRAGTFIPATLDHHEGRARWGGRPVRHVSLGYHAVQPAWARVNKWRISGDVIGEFIKAALRLS